MKKLRDLGIYEILEILSFVEIHFNGHTFFIDQFDSGKNIIHDPPLTCNLFDLYMKYGNFIKKIYFCWKSWNIDIVRRPKSKVEFNLHLQNDEQMIEYLSKQNCNLKFNITYGLKPSSTSEMIKFQEKFPRSKNSNYRGLQYLESK